MAVIIPYGAHATTADQISFSQVNYTINNKLDKITDDKMNNHNMNHGFTFYVVMRI